MPAIDRCQQNVVQALIKEGWQVSLKPYPLSASSRRVYIDLRATRDNSEQLLLIEVKCFADSETTLNDLYTALGQYLVYRSLLAQRGIEADLYLAIPTQIYHRVFKTLVGDLVEQLSIRMILVDLARERIDQWLS